VDDLFSLPDGGARGGTELMLARLRAALPADLLGKFQIVASRLVGPLDGSKLRIAWIHDLAGDPLLGYLKSEGWKRFHLLVFVSNWQMQTFIRAYGMVVSLHRHGERDPAYRRRDVRQTRPSA
jgi:hypothetical protein